MAIEASILHQNGEAKDKNKLDDILFSLRAINKLQSDRRRMGVDRVESYYHNVEGNWLENWEEADSEDCI